ncbi:hypothetical protein RY831_29755 [Noviherbaspirillum sp. CPCC 100848]|uniref:Uncharacterized protein n=1 Tax=Noviherbaspirillum album TaxID=3080276 RepID=A0ABU6JJJ2_9BURK|nr:hypothetical protein [Noviherbaspirillum sp. CPCC 100848]MEC4723342.1 hypothetical protein [Noviherbaspirillum sp. CPCC 100848]
MNDNTVCMREIAFLATILVLGPSLARADAFTVIDQNASLKVTINEPGTPLGIPNDPVQFTQTLEWIVDGRRILVYPSAPSSWLDIGHFHPGSHVGVHQLHAQGPMQGYASSPSQGTVVGGIVYTVEGKQPGGCLSRIWEKIDIVNKTADAITLPLSGMGWKPQGGAHQSGLEMPDWTGRDIRGTTTVYLQGSATTGPSIISPPYAPVAVLPVVVFSGYNPLSQSISVQAGATLTIITELRDCTDVAPTESVPP